MIELPLKTKYFTFHYDEETEECEIINKFDEHVGNCTKNVFTPTKNTSFNDLALKYIQKAMKYLRENKL